MRRTTRSPEEIAERQASRAKRIKIARDSLKVRKLEAEAKLQEADDRRARTHFAMQMSEAIIGDTAAALNAATIRQRREALLEAALKAGDLAVARGVLSDLERLLPPEQAAPPPDVSIEEQRALVIRSAKALGITARDLAP